MPSYGYAYSIFFDVHDGQINGFLNRHNIGKLRFCFGVFSDTRLRFSIVLVV